MEDPIGSRRMTAKLSTHMTSAEMREAISRLFNIPLQMVPELDAEAETSRMRLQFEAVQEITAPLRKLLENDFKTTADKFEELEDIGKFILFFNKGLRIEAGVQKFPDFTLRYNDYTVGVEHTRLWDNKERALFKAAKYYLDATKGLLKDLAELCRTVNVYFDYNQPVIGDSDFNNRKFTKEERARIPIIISDYIRSELTGGTVSKPNFIAHVEITRNEDFRVDVELGQSYLTKVEFTDQLLKCIGKKEEKAVRYREAKTVNGLWLLVVLDDINSYSGFNLELATLPKIKTSNFNSILLFEKFSGKTYFLYDSNL